MEMKCSNCNDIIKSSNLTLSCSHFLCSNCLSRKLLEQKFQPLSSKNIVELTCSCEGKITVPFKGCLENITQPVIVNNKSKKGSHKCFYHKEFKANIFCKDCKKFICKKCQNDEKNPGNKHSNHSIITPGKYQKTMNNIKKNLRFKTFDQCMKFIDAKQDEIIRDFNEKCDKSKKIVEDIFNKIKEIQKNYNLRIEHQKNNLKNIFSIIRQVYNSFYSELEIKDDKIDFPSYEFVSKLNYQISNITCNSINFKEFEEISSALNKIDNSHYYNIKFDFSKINYKESDKINDNEGIIVLCPLKCIENSFACGTEKGKIKIYTKNMEDNEYAESGSWSIDKDPSKTESITSLIEPKKMDNILIAASSDKKLRVLTISNNNNKCTISSVKKEFDNNGIILDIFELNDGRISFSTSDGRIKIWNLNEEYNYNKIIEIKNKDVGFEKCLSEIQIFENDENNKQLVSGGGNINKNEKNGVLKKWDINSGKLEEALLFDNTKSITCITIINNHKLALGSDEGIIIIYDSFNKGGITTIIGHKNYINSMYYLNTNHTLFSCSKDLNIKIWNLDSLQCINTLKKQHTSNIYDIILCNNDLISCSNDHYVNIYTIDDTGDNNDANEENYDDFN